MREYSMTIAQGEQEYGNLFDFPYPLDDDIRERFERNFRFKYRYYDIAFESWEMFRQQLEYKLNTLAPYFNKLYRSTFEKIDIYRNTDIANRGSTGERQREKNFATANNHRHDFTTAGSGFLGVRQSGRAGGNNGAAIETGQRVDRERGIEDSGDSKLNLFTDTPQSGQPLTASESASAGVGSGDKYFNDGYITTATRDLSSGTKINSGTSDGYTNTARETGEEHYELGGEQSREAQQSHSENGAQAYSDSNFVSSRVNTSELESRETGLRGVLQSTAMLEYRKTLMRVDEMFINEFRDLFMDIW